MIEALDAVNLMTVHAAKGLEFPVVFVVNLAKGAGGPPKPVRVALAGDATPSVSVGPFAGEADEAEREREQQELRRLFYVALTRARDFLEVVFPLKYYVKKWSTTDRHTYAQLTRFIPEMLLPKFERAATETPAAIDVAAVTMLDSQIRSRIAGMWK